MHTAELVTTCHQLKMFLTIYRQLTVGQNYLLDHGTVDFPFGRRAKPSQICLARER